MAKIKIGEFRSLINTLSYRIGDFSGHVGDERLVVNLRGEKYKQAMDDLLAAIPLINQKRFASDIQSALSTLEAAKRSIKINEEAQIKAISEGHKICGRFSVGIYNPLTCEREPTPSQLETDVRLLEELNKPITAKIIKVDFQNKRVVA